MKNLFYCLKVKNELKKFQVFKKDFVFEPKEIKTVGQSVFYGDDCLKENEESDWINEGESFVNVSYKSHGSFLAKILSNLFPCEFYFKGHKFSSIEGFFQGLKFKNKKAQKLVFKMSGLDACRIKGAMDYDWRKDHVVWFLGKPYDRFSKEYENLVDELYVSVLKNPIYVQALENVGKKDILHMIGCEDKNETVFSRQEFEFELNCLKEYCLKNK